MPVRPSGLAGPAPGSHDMNVSISRSALRTGRCRRAACGKENRKPSHQPCRATGEQPVARRPRLERFAARRSPERAARFAGQTRGAPMLVHASFAFVDAVERGSHLSGAAALGGRCHLECEALVLSGRRPPASCASAICTARRARFACLSHGVSSRPAVLVRSAQGAAVPPPSIRCRRGTACRRQTAKRRKILYATDGHAASFMQLMDGFAHRVGRRTPLHLPQCLETPGQGDNPRGTHAASGARRCRSGRRCHAFRGGDRAYPSFREGLDQVVEAWRP